MKGNRAVNRPSACSIIAGLGVILLLAGCAVRPETPSDTQDTKIQLTRVDFSNLPGWGKDAELHGAVSAFIKTCNRFMRRSDSYDMGGAGYAGTVGQWRPFCDAAATLPIYQAKTWFEQNFQPYQVSSGLEKNGLFTGYYEPSLTASLKKTYKYHVPIHARPHDLIMVDLGDFRESLKGQRIAGTVKDGHLKPFSNRADIIAGSMDGDVSVLAYADDPVAVFFLHIQGSGRIFLPDGSTKRLGYAAQNGHPYFAIGRELIARGELTRENVSLQTIEAWLKANPDQSQALMNTNKSYVFFRELPESGPIGAAGVVLTPGRSLAVDRTLHPLGIPMWLSTTAKYPDGVERLIQRMVIAQDTGGAIAGAVRGDVFWGSGDDAKFLAGHMKQSGTLYVLLPKFL